jgi:hypothetical protein
MGFVRSGDTRNVAKEHHGNAGNAWCCHAALLLLTSFPDASVLQYDARI